jgi:hypothetical protein
MKMIFLFIYIINNCNFFVVYDGLSAHLKLYLYTHMFVVMFTFQLIEANIISYTLIRSCLVTIVFIFVNISSSFRPLEICFVSLSVCRADDFFFDFFNIYLSLLQYLFISLHLFIVFTYHDFILVFNNKTNTLLLKHSNTSRMCSLNTVVLLLLVLSIKSAWRRRKVNILPVQVVQLKALSLNCYYLFFFQF